MLDGLALWKRNVDKKFAGVEECMVCFSVIHPSNYQLPKLQCKVCKKKFHSACLVSTIPIYQNLNGNIEKFQIKIVLIYTAKSHLSFSEIQAELAI